MTLLAERLALPIGFIAGLRRLGRDSSVVVLYRTSDDPSVRAFEPPMELRTRLRRRLRRRSLSRSLKVYQDSRPGGYEAFTEDHCQFRDGLMEQLSSADVVNLHWVSDFVDYGSFLPFATDRTLVVWTLHDMNVFTGGCHYDDGCRRYEAQCGCCPQLGSADPYDLSHEVWERKKRLFDGLDPRWLHFVTPSRWLAGEAERSPLLRRFPVSVIPNGLDTDDFAPRDRQCARSTLGIPQDADVVLFIAEGMHIRRKGFLLLAQALMDPQVQRRAFLISVGAGNPTMGVPVPHVHLGHLSDDRLLSLVYSAADVYVIPSLQDNLPNTALESLACGTPVVAFAVGGIPEVVRSGVTGLLAPPGDVPALRAAILQMLDDELGRAAMANHCRRIALSEYALEVQARRYVELYEGMQNHTSHQVRNGAGSPATELAQLNG